MTDRELLERAAKAAGLDTPRFADGSLPNGKIGISTETGPYCQRLWNPLTNDGDALRLAVKLGFVCGFVWPNCWAELPGEHPAYEPCDPDPYSAARRAIVRAAAAMYKD